MQDRHKRETTTLVGLTVEDCRGGGPEIHASTIERCAGRVSDFADDAERSIARRERTEAADEERR